MMDGQEKSGFDAAGETFLAIASFLVIFAFSTVDSSVSPLVQVLSDYFKVGEARTLYLVTACTSGTVLGILLGPALTASCRIIRLLNTSVLCLIVGHALFLLAETFTAALAARFLFGLASGLFASCMWWITFYGVSREGREKMIMVLMSARPLATALGVPLVGMIADFWTWKPALWGCFLLLSGAAAFMALYARRLAQESLDPFSPGKVVADYLNALKIPQAAWYYVGFTLNRMCYFGFYVLAGIWFHRHYGTSLADVSRALLLIGVAEAAASFVVPAIRRWIGHRLAFHGCLWLSLGLFPLFIFGGANYALTLAMITVFMILDRVYCMSLVVTLPDMFPTAPNRTVFGSLNTLTAWAALTAVSFLQGRFLDAWGLEVMQAILCAVLIIGSLMLIKVQNLTIGAGSMKHTVQADSAPEDKRA